MQSYTDNAHEIMDVMKRAQDALRARFLKLVAPYKLTVAQFKVLQHLRWHDRRGGLGICELSEHLGLANSTTSGIVDRLERDGWVERDRSGLDRREVKVRIKEKGQELFERTPRDVEEFWMSTIGKLSAKDQVGLLNSLRKLKDAMEEPEWPTYDEIHAGRRRALEDDKSNTRRNLEEILSDELRKVGLLLVLARQAEEEGHFEATAYLKQMSVEEAGHAFRIVELLGQVEDIRPRLKELIEAEVNSKVVKLKAAKAAEEEAHEGAVKFLENAACDEERHKSALETVLAMLESKEQPTDQKTGERVV